MPFILSEIDHEVHFTTKILWFPIPFPSTYKAFGQVSEYLEEFDFYISFFGILSSVVCMCTHFPLKILFNSWEYVKNGFCPKLLQADKRFHIFGHCSAEVCFRLSLVPSFFLSSENGFP